VQNHCKYEFSPSKSNKDENGVFLQAHGCLYLSMLVACLIQFSMLTCSESEGFHPVTWRNLTPWESHGQTVWPKPIPTSWFFLTYCTEVDSSELGWSTPYPDELLFTDPPAPRLQPDVLEQHQDYARGSDLTPTHKPSFLEQPVDHLLLIQQLIQGKSQMHPLH